MHVHSFAPIVDASSRVLVLGSMPGKASLRAGEYYAHPRNLFWPLMQTLLGVDSSLPYESRTKALLARGVGVWDVLKSCTRTSSLDSDIVESSIVVNDLAGLLQSHPSIRTICFNGQKAVKTFDKHLAPVLAEAADSITFHSLPSTSPANASIPLPKKQAAWKVVVAATGVHSR